MKTRDIALSTVSAIARGSSRTGTQHYSIVSLLLLLLLLLLDAGHNSCAQTPTQVVAWGDNASGQCGVPEGLTDAIMVSAGDEHSVALLRDGTVVAWGGNSYGQTDVPNGLSGVVAVAAGGAHTLALRGDGTVVAWGNNDYGQCDVPVGLRDVVQVAAGAGSLALKADGTVVGWGNIWWGESSPPSGLTDVVAVAIGGLALKADGTVVGWAQWQSTPAGLTEVVAIALRDQHGLALKQDGTVIQWGGWGGTVPEGLSDVVAVAAGGYYPAGDHSLALKADGTVVAWGWNGHGQTDIPNGLSGVVALAAGGAHSLAIVGAEMAPELRVPAAVERVLPVGLGLTLWAPAVGSLPLSYQWYRDGQVIVGATTAVLDLPHVQMADAGTYSVEVSNAFGSVRSEVGQMEVVGNGVIAWGNNSSGQCNVPAGLIDVVSVAAGALHSVALRSDGTVVAWGGNGYGQCEVPVGLQGVVQVAAGDYQTLALKGDSTVVAWGYAHDDWNWGPATVPVGLTNVVQVAAGGGSLALLADGTVVGWGLGYQAGVPAGLTDVLSIAAGGNLSLALKADGTVVGWGQWQSTPPTGLTEVVAIGARGQHCLAVKQDGTVIQWGDSGGTVPEGLSEVVAAAAGGYYPAGDHSLALKTDGTVVAWGANGDGRAEIPNGLSGVVTLAVGAAHNLAVVHSGMVPEVRVAGPVQRVLPVGMGLMLSPSIVGSLPLSYQWYRDGQVIVGATTAVLDLPHVQMADAGAYSVKVSNAFGSVSSEVGQVEVVGNGVIAWGNNSSGQCNVPAGLIDVVSVAAGALHSVALRSDGTVVAWGNNTYGQSDVPSGLSGVVAVAAGDIHTLALKGDGTVVAWGYTHDAWNSEPATVPEGLSDVVQVAAAGGSLALRADGTVVGWGLGAQAGVPAGLTDVVRIAAGGELSFALKSDGTVVGRGPWWTPVPPSELTGVVGIAASYQHCVALKQDGLVVQWGTYVHAIPAGLSAVVAIAAGGYHPAGNLSLALKQDGTVGCWGANGFGQAEIPNGLSGVVTLAAGGAHSLAAVGAVPPLLVLLGDNPMTVERGSAFVDPGARARDVRDLDLTSRITVDGSVDAQHVGAYSLTYSVTTDDGRAASKTRTVKVVDSTADTTPPTVTCPPAITLAADESCQAAIPDVLANVTAADDRGGPVALSQEPAAGTPVGLGAYTITVMARDEAGNTSSCTVAVTIVDSTPPGITCPANVVVPTDPGQCAAVVNYPAPTATDNCSSVTVTYDPPSGSAFPQGTTTVACIAADAAGNTASCSFTVTVRDTEPPTITCPTAVTVSTDAGQCSASGVALGSPVTADNCGVGSVSNDAPAQFPKGVSMVTWTVTDTSGNTTRCQQSVTVTDTEAPIAVGPPDIAVNTDPGQCSAVVTFTATATDNCAGVMLVCNPPSGWTFPKGATTVTCAATDAAGNTARHTFTVTVIDVEPPTIGAIVAPVDPVQVGTAVSASASFTDNCDLASAVWTWGDGSQSAGTVGRSTISGSHTYAAAGVYTLTLTVTDQAENTAQAEYRFVVVYDPEGGFVTGGGWINSPAGAYAPDPALTGKATFGFVSKYQKGATVPTGQTQFNFHAARMDFHSTSYQWLVVAGAKAQYKGYGTINGGGDYGFILTAIDGQVSGGGGIDKFRIKIWEKATGAMVYDNQMEAADDADPTTAIQGGSIVIHKEK